MAEDPESFKIGTGNRKVFNYEENKAKNNPIIQNNYYTCEDRFENQSIKSNVSKNPIPYGEESIAERINKINALNKRGNYADPKLYEKQRQQNAVKNVFYSPKKVDKKEDDEGYLQGMLDNYNLLQEKMVI